MTGIAKAWSLIMTGRSGSLRRTCCSLQTSTQEVGGASNCKGFTPHTEIKRTTL